MSELPRSSPDRPTDPYSWSLLAYSAILAGSGLVWLGWLFWSFVPLHAAVFEGFGAEAILPPSTTFVIVASSWFVRLLPFAVLLCLMAGGGGILLLAGTPSGKAGPTVYRGVVSALLLGGLLEIGLGVLVVHAVHNAYQAMASDASYQRNLQAFAEFRRQQSQPDPQP